MTLTSSITRIFQEWSWVHDCLALRKNPYISTFYQIWSFTQRYTYAQELVLHNDLSTSKHEKEETHTIQSWTSLTPNFWKLCRKSAREMIKHRMSIPINSKANTHTHTKNQIRCISTSSTKQIQSIIMSRTYNSTKERKSSPMQNSKPWTIQQAPN